MKVTEQISTNSRVIKDLLTKYKDTFTAICELMNNSIQAKANRIELTIAYNPGLTLKSPISKLIIKDNGLGVTTSDFKKKILEIGTDVKKGGQGIGRFGALQLGEKMTIETVGYDNTQKKYSKTVFPLDASQISSSLSKVNFEYETQMLSKSKTYYKVTIENLHHNKQEKVIKKNKVSEQFLPEHINQAIFEKYPFQIFNKKVQFFINDKLLDPQDFIIGDPSYKAAEYIDTKGNSVAFTFRFYQIKSQLAKVKVFFCVENSGIQTVAHEYTYSSDWYTPDLGTWFIYVESPFFNSDLFRNIDMDGLGDDEVKGLKDFTKDTINEFFKAKNKRFEKFIAELSGDKYYPTSFETELSKSRELVFQKVAYLLEDEYKLLTKEDNLRGLFYNLIDKALSSGYIEDIFIKVLNLSDETLQKFHSLLERTELENLISFSSSVANKIEFLDFLNEIVYGDISKILKERSQLHKIIERQLWIFGEAYSGTTHLWSDTQLGNTLKELRDKYFNYEPTLEDENLDELPIEGAQNITDLFFLNEKILDNEDREVMIVELKSPKCAIGKKEIQQIDDYAFTVERYPGLPKEKMKYKFILISSRMNEYAKSKMRSSRERFQEPFLYDKKTDKNIEVYIMEWADLIESNKRKLGYLSTKLRVKNVDVKEKFETEYPEIINEKLSSRLTVTKKQGSGSI
jgi:hypothetical protein